MTLKFQLIGFPCLYSEWFFKYYLKNLMFFKDYNIFKNSADIVEQNYLYLLDFNNMSSIADFWFSK